MSKHTQHDETDEQKNEHDEAVDAPETPQLRVGAPEDGDEATDAPSDAQDGDEGTDGDEDEGTEGDTSEQDMFPRPVVEKLRRENANLRDRARRSDDLAAALWTARVEALGQLADPTDLPMPEDADPLDADAIQAAVSALVERKPHLASRVPRGDVAQGPSVTGAAFSLTDMLRANA